MCVHCAPPPRLCVLRAPPLGCVCSGRLAPPLGCVCSGCRPSVVCARVAWRRLSVVCGLSAAPRLRVHWAPGASPSVMCTLCTWRLPLGYVYSVRPAPPPPRLASPRLHYAGRHPRLQHAQLAAHGAHGRRRRSCRRATRAPIHLGREPRGARRAGQARQARARRGTCAAAAHPRSTPTAYAHSTLTQTLARLPNWDKMTPDEQERTVRILAKRNQARLEKLRQPPSS